MLLGGGGASPLQPLSLNTPSTRSDRSCMGPFRYHTPEHTSPAIDDLQCAAGKDLAAQSPARACRLGSTREPELVRQHRAGACACGEQENAPFVTWPRQAWGYMHVWLRVAVAGAPVLERCAVVHHAA